MSSFTRFTNVDEAKVIQVVVVKSIIGDGVEGDPIRQITEYFDLDGVRLARTDSEYKMKSRIGKFEYEENEVLVEK